MSTKPCPRCDAKLVEITIRVDGDDVLMRSCSNCEGRWWYRDGEAMGLDGVLNHISDSDTKRPTASARA